MNSCRSRKVADRKDTSAAMSQRVMNLLWLKDTLEHLTSCQQQLEWAQDAESVQVLTETMLRDLECCRRLCEAIHQRAQLQHAT
jgi:hypothetical protein